ncbi:hypothetical protein Pcinc_035349 [Petrolisthes cinctipes]|uniref:Uncharacterized protein n=1 Tax=Petrolisthes cinctipes TaxID=88211 RepID=A0AAE1C031_PETCI|nr:hypothetical protein Pcinc_035349 [Petrolisthes cinctipes]
MQEKTKTEDGKMTEMQDNEVIDEGGKIKKAGVLLLLLLFCPASRCCSIIHIFSAVTTLLCLTPQLLYHQPLANHLSTSTN